ncbi:MAG: class I SAM-dependent methyltransferase [Chloroflexi bacterium]|nr:class I SAM-dependent methyltransferase [Chloroflexota bacterium]
MTAAVILSAAAVAALAFVLAWRLLARRASLPCPTACLWLLENRMMERVAGAELLLDRAGVQPGMTVLDAGCGPGRLTIPLAARVGPAGQVLAVDLQPGMLDRLQARLESQAFRNVRTLRAALGAGMLPAGIFDRAFLVTVLGEIPDRLAALREIRAALKPGGVLSLTEVFPDPHYQSRQSVRRLAEAAGFRVVEVFGSWRAFTLNLARPE